jgi:hypothetical protein
MEDESKLNRERPPTGHRGARAPRRPASDARGATRIPKKDAKIRWVAPIAPSPPLLLTVDEAAPRLGLTEDALRARLRRAATVNADGSISAPLLPGVVGVRMGAHWRVRFAVEA